jgi:hypothetical protein
VPQSWLCQMGAVAISIIAGVALWQVVVLTKEDIPLLFHHLLLATLGIPRKTLYDKMSK